jgi:hypothetical protein
LTYGRFINALKKANVLLDRKVLSDIGHQGCCWIRAARRPCQAAPRFRNGLDRKHLRHLFQ